MKPTLPVSIFLHKARYSRRRRLRVAGLVKKHVNNNGICKKKKKKKHDRQFEYMRQYEAKKNKGTHKNEKIIKKYFSMENKL